MRWSGPGAIPARNGAAAGKFVIPGLLYVVWMNRKLIMSSPMPGLLDSGKILGRCAIAKRDMALSVVPEILQVLNVGFRAGGYAMITGFNSDSLIDISEFLLTGCFDRHRADWKLGY